jgi:hypothetical protein
MVRAGVILSVVLMAATPCRAGLYNTGEVFPLDTQFDFRSTFRATLIRLRNIPAPKLLINYPLRTRYLVAEAANPSKLQDAEEKMNLSEVLIRRGKLTEADALLRELGIKNRTNFLIQSNRATLYHLTGGADHLHRAIAVMKDEVLGQWPEHFGDLDKDRQDYLLSIGWNEGPYGYYRKVETYYLKLLQLRVPQAGFGKKAALETVDDIFADAKGSPVRFVGEKGTFEPGKLAKTERAKLPQDALEIVRQLLIWLPADARLYRLLGEVHNALADGAPAKEAVTHVLAAKTIFTDLGEEPYNFRSEDFKERRSALQNVQIEEKEPDIEEALKKEESARGVDWRTLGVGFGAGLLVALFGIWQIRELRRRRAGS